MTDESSNPMKVSEPKNSALKKSPKYGQRGHKPSMDESDIEAGTPLLPSVS